MNCLASDPLKLALTDEEDGRSARNSFAVADAAFVAILRVAAQPVAVAICR